MMRRVFQLSALLRGHFTYLLFDSITKLQGRNGQHWKQNIGKENCWKEEGGAQTKKHCCNISLKTGLISITILFLSRCMETPRGHRGFTSKIPMLRKRKNYFLIPNSVEVTSREEDLRFKVLVGRKQSSQTIRSLSFRAGQHAAGRHRSLLCWQEDVHRDHQGRRHTEVLRHEGSFPPVSF